MPKKHAQYHVGLKILLRKKEQVLFLLNSEHKRFDLPGGRIDHDEHDTPLERIIAREIWEELGPKVQYKLGKPLFQFRRHFHKNNLHVFITVYEAEFISGDVKLSKEHVGMKWLNPKTYSFKKKEFGHQEEFDAFIKYFYSLK